MGKQGGGWVGVGRRLVLLQGGVICDVAGAAGGGDGSAAVAAVTGMATCLFAAAAGGVEWHTLSHLGAAFSGVRIIGARALFSGCYFYYRLVFGAINV